MWEAYKIKGKLRFLVNGKGIGWALVFAYPLRFIAKIASSILLPNIEISKGKQIRKLKRIEWERKWIK